MFNPVSTYRIQFHKEFNFRQFEVIIPYLARLGVKTIYASPIFKATPGSMHGYDVTDPLSINPEIGTLEELKVISEKLKKLGINWLQDIVPNHMAFHPDNAWLMDVLKNGRQSVYAPYFDILWDIPGQNGQLMVPFLGKSFEEAVADGELSVTFNSDLFFSYMGQNYPLNEATHQLLKISADAAPDEASLKKISADQELMKQVSALQYYRVCSWEETNRQINYRRFFTVNGLICLNIQDQQVFDGYHQLIGDLVKDDLIQGLRVDHIDGLYDPEIYLKRLRKLAGADVYIITEKILETGESFPGNWPVQGNTGYDMLSVLNNLFTNKKSKKKLTSFYKTLHTGKGPVEQRVFEKKRLILTDYMQGELENLYRLFLSTLTDKQPETPGIKEAIAELMVLFPTYRMYGNRMPLPESDEEVIRHLLKKVKDSKPKLAVAAEMLGEVLLEWPQKAGGEQNERILKFYQRLMQFTGPLMAKGVEDTLMYTYNRFVDHNEVGDSPGSFGLKPKEFHKEMAKRTAKWPVSMTATSTHDTKRGEDVRARLNVLSDLADDWIENVKHWQDLNINLKSNDQPDANDEYFIYQTITGAMPMPGGDEADFSKRLSEYLVKALREGKVNSNWAQPDEAYEEAAKEFADTVVHQISSTPFFKQVADHGIINSLSQVLVKYTMPGIPDLYQGCEFWDLSLVDPDNRRPVGYQDHTELLAAVDTENINWEELWNQRYNGCIKQQLTSLLLRQRSLYPDLFTTGEYIPLKIKGTYKKNILAFARQSGKDWIVTVIPLHFAAIAGSKAQPQQFDWDDTEIQLPGNAPRYWQNLLNRNEDYAAGHIAVKSIFKELPVALLKLSDKNNKRSAGILMHISSLPSDLGVGDLGPAAYKFADFLFASGQKYWQLLPVNPVDKSSDFSPYSSTSVMAGNTLLISPELLVENGCLSRDDIANYHITIADKADLDQAKSNKNELFALAYNNFLRSGNADLFEQFQSFKSKEAYWLNDYALYELLKEKHNGKAWYQWPKLYRSRDGVALQNIASAQDKNLDKIKWLQWIFSRQWQELKSYCENKSITLLGDMPFYTSYDSVDVWSNPGLFKLDQKGNVAGIAGVPPDYFSADGQLWGMPVYNWEAHKSENYQWWTRRIKKNLEYFDQIRLDHFRAFSNYWEVPAGNDTAVNGKWQTGPGKEFFEVLKKSGGGLPFVAEDLGDISEDVYELRDMFGLPGMRVLQFAFDEALPVSPHIPHNYTQNCVAYTGTHDNNTALGWFKNDADKPTRKRMQIYTGQKITAKNVNMALIKLCYASVADTVIIPVQDILGLDEDAKMNTPSSGEGNWRWKMESFAPLKSAQKTLLKFVTTFNR